MGAVGAMILAAFKRLIDGDPRRFNFAIVKSATEATAKLSAFVLFILIGARIFSLTFYGVNGHIWVEHLLTSLPGGQVGFLIFINVLVFLLAFFLDFFEIAFIVIPLLKPAVEYIFTHDPQALAIAKSFNLTTPEEIARNMIVWFGIMLGVNMQTSFMHPPFGFSLFYLRSVAPKEPYKDRVTGKLTEPVTTGQIYWGAIPFVVIQCVMVGLVMYFPGMSISKKPDAPAIDQQKGLEQLKNLPGMSGAPGGFGGAPGGFGGAPGGFGAPPFGAPPAGAPAPGASPPAPATPAPQGALPPPPSFGASPPSGTPPGGAAEPAASPPKSN
jgi:hypothetical protein